MGHSVLQSSNPLPIGWTVILCSSILMFGIYKTRKAIIKAIGEVAFRTSLRVMSHHFQIRMDGEPAIQGGKEHVPLYDVRYSSTMVPMPDGIKLSTLHLAPVPRTAGEDCQNKGTYTSAENFIGPVVLMRTPYSQFLGKLFAHMFAQRGEQNIKLNFLQPNKKWGSYRKSHRTIAKSKRVLDQCDTNTGLN